MNKFELRLMIKESMNNYISENHNRIAKMFLIAGIVAGVVLYFS